MRIVSLLPSATEILFALGFDHEIVGVSHECDSPAKAKTKAVVIHSRIPHGASPAEIDRIVRDYVARGESVYAVDVDLLEDLAPDLIVTQDLCHVCAASPDDLAAALSRFDRRPEVLCLNPLDLGDVWRDILWVGEETRREQRAQAVVNMIGARLGELEIAMESVKGRPRVALLEWLQPFYVGGHWVPEMIARAGGEDIFGQPRTPSFRISIDEVIDAAPDVLLIAPCGYDKEQARDEYLSLQLPKAWNDIPAVQNARVFALDANSYVSRPSPRLVTGIEAMAKALHPALPVRAGAEAAFVRVEEKQRPARAAGA